MRTLTLTFALLLTSVLALAQGTYTQIDVPNSSGTSAFGINSAGDIVGSYIGTDGRQHGFLLSGGVYTTIEVPDALDTACYGINDVGQIVGFSSVTNHPVGFLYDVAAQTFTTLSLPNAIETTPMAINNTGVIVGSAYVPHGTDNLFVGFQYVSGTYRVLLPNGFTSAYLTSLNNVGVGVGAGAAPSGAFVSFLFHQGSFRGIEIPASQATAYGINDQNAIVGYYPPNRHSTEGFLLQNGTFQPLRFPASSITAAIAINSSGLVVGYFEGDGLTNHGFLWAPAAPQKGH